MALLSSALSLQLPTLIVGRSIQAVSAAWLTRIAGRGFITYFRQDQDWGDGGMQEVLQREYDLNRREGAMGSFLQSAFSRVVEPLQRQRGLRLPPRPERRRRGPQEAGEAGDHGHQAR